MNCATSHSFRRLARVARSASGSPVQYHGNITKRHILRERVKNAGDRFGAGACRKILQQGRYIGWAETLAVHPEDHLGAQPERVDVCSKLAECRLRSSFAIRRDP